MVTRYQNYSNNFSENYFYSILKWFHASRQGHFDDQNITFAKDISAIVTTPRVARFEEAKGGRHNLVLLPHPEK